RHDSAYHELVLKFVQHFLWIASAMIHIGEESDSGMWDEADGFFYDVIRLPDGRSSRLKVRSMVGLLPLCAATTFDIEAFANISEEVHERFNKFLEARPELIANIHDLRKPGHADRRMISIVDETRLRRILTIMLDENEFLSPYGLRSLSKRHAEHP